MKPSAAALLAVPVGATIQTGSDLERGSAHTQRIQNHSDTVRVTPRPFPLTAKREHVQDLHRYFPTRLPLDRDAQLDLHRADAEAHVVASSGVLRTTQLIANNRNRVREADF